MRSSKSIMTGVAVLATLALPMVAGAANKLVVNGTDGTTPKMVVTDTGAIGSGTSTPSVAINVVGSTSATSQILTQFSGVTTSSGGGGFVGYHNNATGALPNANDRLGYMLFGSYDGTTPRNAAGFTVRADGAWSATSTPTSFTFETNPVGSIGRAERMKITNAGNVGIGASAPTQRVEVQGGIRLNPWSSNVQPACDATLARGTFWLVRGTTTTSDTIQFCVKDSSNNYSWKTLAFTP